MDWTRPIDIYCERLDPSFWAEPVNALSNGAFLVAAAWAVRLTRGDQHPREAAMIGCLAAIGIGSFLFHTYANPWSQAADVVPIVGFILVYVHAANRLFLGLSRRVALVATMGFLPYAAGSAALFATLPGFAISAFYWPVAVLIALYAFWTSHHGQRQVALGLGVGAALLTLSLVARSVDLPLCPALPLGTHFLWHILNAVLLGWMIRVHHRARVRM